MEAQPQLAVGVTGAHYCGFPSPDSDLDLKGIHVAPTHEMVALRPPPDTIDFLGIFEGLEIDYTSHELAAALRLLLKGKAETQTVKGLLYAYRSALTGIHLLRTGECVGDVTRLAPLYGFDRVPDLVARKRSRPEHGELAAKAAEFDHDLARLESLLEIAHRESTLPAEAPNAEALNQFLVRVRRHRFA
jgi:uncharacterized protein